jgi:mRNA interferase RelE/StbE
VSYQVNWEIHALDQAAGFLRDDPVGVAALWDTVSQLADEPQPPESCGPAAARWADRR